MSSKMRPLDNQRRRGVARTEVLNNRRGQEEARTRLLNNQRGEEAARNRQQAWFDMMAAKREQDALDRKQEEQDRILALEITINYMDEATLKRLSANNENVYIILHFKNEYYL
jgi:membrane protein involved in colicin uptake